MTSLSSGLRDIAPCECKSLKDEDNHSLCDECQRRECFEWTWDKESGGSTCEYSNNDRDVLFNPGFSVGTMGIRGSKPLTPGAHYYWEIKMSTEVYGTDMMIGVGTEKSDLKGYSHNFVSLLGRDYESWGLGYNGHVHHGGMSRQYCDAFGQHAIMGVHVDLWTGTLEFYLNRKPMGVAYKGLLGKTLYPMISSTSARSGMNLIFCRSYPATLQLQTLLAIGRQIPLPENTSLFRTLTCLPPGMMTLLKNNFWWISCKNWISTVPVNNPDADVGVGATVSNTSQQKQSSKSIRRKKANKGSSQPGVSLRSSQRKKDEQQDESSNSSPERETKRMCLRSSKK